MSDEYLLDISTEEPVRKKIKIDGKPYQLAAPEDFPYHEYLWMADVGKRFEQLNKDKYSEQKGKEGEKLLDAFVKKAMLDAPDEILAELNDIQKIRIVNVFSQAVAQSGVEPRPSTGD